MTVPVRTPAVSSVRLSGRPTADQAYGGAPPVAVNAKVYGLPMVAAGKDVLVMVGAVIRYLDCGLTIYAIHRPH